MSGQRVIGDRLIGRPIRNDMNQTQIRPALITDAELNARNRRRAVLTVADHATGVDDCAQLLDILGLHPAEGKTP